MNKKNTVLVGLILILLAVPVFSQEQTDSGELSNKPVIISRLDGKIELDGRSDEEAWKDIHSLPVVMQSPVFGAPPSEKTEVFLGYNDDFFYVAGRLYDSEPDKIQAPSKKRDSMNPSNDWFGIIIDTFNDNENALGFFTTPAGLRFDATVYNDAQGEFPVNLSWNTFWDVATFRNEEGWFVEMRIPFSSLRFQDDKGNVVMGLISWRYIARKNEVNIFPAISQKWGNWAGWKPSKAQDIVLEEVSGRKPFQIAPNAIGGFGRSYDLNDAETEYIRSDEVLGDIGLDVKVGLASNLTLDVTFNTDFAQVEADDQQVNLTRFSLFFPEKRIFFQERSSTFDFNLGGPNTLFYSRRIGIYDGQEVPIYGGVRLVGRLGAWDLGILDMQTAPIEDLPSENFGVVRIRRRIFNPYSYMGGIVASRIGVDGTYNIAFGLDGIFRVFGDDYLSFNLAQTLETEEENRLFSLDSSKLKLTWERRTLEGLGYNLDFSRAGESYNPGMGFEMREDYMRFGNRILYGWIPDEEARLLNHQIFMDGYAFVRNSDGQFESVEIGPGWVFNTKSGYGGQVGVKYYFEDVLEEFDFSDDVSVPTGRYSFYGLTGFYSTPYGNYLHTGFNFDAGSFYDGWRVSLGVTPRWNISSSLEVQGMYQINWVEFPDRGETFLAHIARLRVLTMLSTKLTISALLQYNSAADAVIANIRLRFNPREGNDLYLVYNEGINIDRYRELPVLPRISGRAVMIKYTYTFNLK